MRKDKTPPDPRRQALLHEAYEVLSDPQRRAAYDASLGDPGFAERPRSATIDVKWLKIGAGVLAAAAAAYFVLRPAAPPPGGSQKELLESALLSLGRVMSVSVSGRNTPVSFSVTIEEGVMMTTCHDIGPGSQLVVSNGPRLIPARVNVADTELDLCRLTVETGGAWPVKLSTVEARAGDKVFALGVNANGEFALIEGKVKGLIAGPKGKVIEITNPIPMGTSGGPLLDPAGKLVGITTVPHAYGPGMHVALPVSWIAQARGRAGKK